jgi:hypothetical protein
LDPGSPFNLTVVIPANAGTQLPGIAEIGFLKEPKGEWLGPGIRRDDDSCFLHGNVTI